MFFSLFLVMLFYYDHIFFSYNLPIFWYSSIHEITQIFLTFHTIFSKSWNLQINFSIYYLNQNIIFKTFSLYYRKSTTNIVGIVIKMILKLSAQNVYDHIIANVLRIIISPLMWTRMHGYALFAWNLQDPKNIKGIDC